MPDQSDEQLVFRARDGDRASLDVLLRRYQDRVYSMAYRILGHREDALDVAQEVFVTVFRRIAGFEAKARFSTWLYRVTVNRCRDELRRRGSLKHARPLSLDAAPPGESAAFEPASPEPAPAQAAAENETLRIVEEAITKLPEDAREVLVLRDRQDLSYEEIAAVLEIPVGTVRSRLNRARTLLRDRIQPILGVEP